MAPTILMRMTLTVAMTLTASPGSSNGQQPGEEQQAREVAIEAYVYGYPLVTMEMTRRISTNTDAPKDSHAPMGQFFSAKTYPNASFRDVTAPNADTLYSTAWLDLSKEPYVLSVPNAKDRYWMMPLLDGWTNVFADPGQRTTGGNPQTWAITGPGWTGTLPPNVRELKSPTNLVWILGRTYSSGTPQDLKAVHAFQDELHLVPLSAYGKPYAPPPGKVDPRVDMKTPVRDQVNRLDAQTYFGMLASLMAKNPPSPEDRPMLQKLQTLGIVPGRDFSLGALSPPVAQAVRESPQAGQQRIQAHSLGTVVNGWEYSTQLGKYGTDYLLRAFTAALGLGANLPDDAIYPVSLADAAGQPYRGATGYVLHFPAGQTPPVKAFWSLTMYDPSFFFFANPLNRYTLSPRNDLKYNKDGSLDLYLSSQSPGADKQSNWLPAPSEKFLLVLRLYWPDKSPPTILDGSWKPPPVLPAPPPTGVGGAGKQEPSTR